MRRYVLRNYLVAILLLVLIFSFVLTACGSAGFVPMIEADLVKKQTLTKEAEITAGTQEVETTQTISEPVKITITIEEEPDTLDPHKTAQGSSVAIMSQLGSSLVMVDPQGEIIPYLAKSWEVSDDGRTYTFHLREDVLFQNGTPLTAQDFVYTFKRAIDPDTKSPLAAALLDQAKYFRAVDDYTFVITLEEPYYPFLSSLVGPYLQPLSQSWVEEIGEESLGRNPMGVGPYKLTDWQTGYRILLDVNPDYVWGPEVYGSGPYQIDQIEYFIIYESATIVAGLEAGMIDNASISTEDLDLFRTLPFDILEVPFPGNAPHIAFNVAAAPLDDINVRKALNMAFDREVILEILFQGYGEIQYGPLSPSMKGYWEGVEQVGYPHDPDGARALLEESGYELNEDGIYEKDGLPLSFVLYTPPNSGSVKFSELAQVMFENVGVMVKIQQEDINLLIERMVGGDYQMALIGYGYDNADIMYLTFHSSQVGFLNWYQVNDPELDAVLEQTRYLMDPEAHQQAVYEAQRIITENAYFISAVASTSFEVISNRVKNYGFNPYVGLWLNQAYIN